MRPHAHDDREAASDSRTPGPPAPPGPPAHAGDPAGVIVRPLTSREDFEACRALESEVWGQGDSDPTPMPMLIVLTHIGGLVAGAFEPSGELLGFVLSLVGTRDGEVMHWSHLLAVRDSARNRGIGRRLKEYQLAELARRGITHVYWSFDPLVTKNAHLNINRLGARVVEYVLDLYGVTRSPLHYGLPTDRFVVACPTGERDAARRPAADRGAVAEQRATSTARYPILTPFPQPGDVRPPEDRTGMPVVLVEVPPDIQTVLAREPEAAAKWRAATRDYFTWALAHGYQVVGIVGGAEYATAGPAASSRAFYILEAATGNA